MSGESTETHALHASCQTAQVSASTLVAACERAWAHGMERRVTPERDASMHGCTSSESRSGAFLYTRDRSSPGASHSVVARAPATRVPAGTRPVVRRVRSETVAEDQIVVHYQPLIDVRTGSVLAVEALARWDRPGHGLVSPAEFIPAAEDIGLIVPLGERVLQVAADQLVAWRDLAPDLTMMVNLSVRQLMHEQIIRDVREAVDDAGLDPSTVTMEITETTLMHDTEMTRERLAELREIGVSLAVDDFGTGYSSLQYVQRFPIDIIKIDRSFVTGLGTNPGDGAVVQSMIELSQRLGVHTVAEGIDRPEQVTLLQSLGADLGQGYLFSKPVVADQITALLDASPHENPKFLLH